MTAPNTPLEQKIAPEIATPDCPPKALLAAFVIANLSNVAIVLCGLFALGATFFSPPELTTTLLRASLFTALGASAISILTHSGIWLFEKMHPESPHAVQHWISAHAASIAGFLGANWMWFHP